MKTIRHLLLLGSLFLSMAHGRAALNVVATLPDFGAIARQIGGEHVKVTTLTRGTEDPHSVDPRPSFIRILNQADVLLESGVELEIGWLPSLVAGARNPRILPGRPGRVSMATGLDLLDVLTGPLDRSKGDVHPAGNPHYWLDPINGRIMAGRLAALFTALDATHAGQFQTNFQKFSNQLEAALAQWERQMTPYRGTPVLTYHKSFDYFARRFGLEVIDQLEPRPGIEPSANHLNALIPRAKERGVKLVLIEPNRPRKTPEYVAQAIGARVLLLPDKVDALEGTPSYLSVFSNAVTQITTALRERK